ITAAEADPRTESRNGARSGTGGVIGRPHPPDRGPARARAEAPGRSPPEGLPRPCPSRDRSTSIVRPPPWLPPPRRPEELPCPVRGADDDRQAATHRLGGAHTEVFILARLDDHVRPPE